MEFLPLLLHGMGQGIASTVPGMDTLVPGTHLPPPMAIFRLLSSPVCKPKDDGLPNSRVPPRGFMDYYRFSEEILAGWSWNLVAPKIEGEESRELSTENHTDALSHRGDIPARLGAKDVYFVT